MSQATIIEVATQSHTYRVHVGKGTIRRLAKLIKDAGGLGKCFIVSSPTVWKLHGDKIKSALKRAETLLIPDGERSKTLQTASSLYEPLIQSGADRSITIVAVGGGVIGDVVGFAASTFLRGVRLVHVPTFADFLIATEAEVNKVSWPTRNQLVQATGVVLVFMVFVTLFLFVSDALWQYALTAIGVLPGSG